MATADLGGHYSFIKNDGDFWFSNVVESWIDSWKELDVFTPHDVDDNGWDIPTRTKIVWSIFFLIPFIYKKTLKPLFIILYNYPLFVRFSSLLFEPSVIPTSSSAYRQWKTGIARRIPGGSYFHYCPPTHAHFFPASAAHLHRAILYANAFFCLLCFSNLFIIVVIVIFLTGFIPQALVL